MTDALSSKELTVATKSRLIRAIHYEPQAQRLAVLTTHGSLKIHEGVPEDAAKMIAEHDHPGHAYLSLKPELGRRKSLYTPSGFLTARRARRAMQDILN